MPDIGALSAALASFKAAKDIAEAMIGLRDAAAFQGKMIEFQSKIIDANNAVFAAQEERSALLSRVGELEAKVADLESWEAQKQRYQLEALQDGVFAYVLKKQADSSEPTHSVCPDCFHEKQISIIQTSTRMPGLCKVQICHRCGWDAYITGQWHPEHGSTPASSRRK